MDLLGIVGLTEHCSFCFLPSESLCSWPVSGYHLTTAGALEIGDMSQNIGRTRVGKVIAIRAVDHYGLLEVTIDRVRKVPGLARTDVYKWHATAKVLKLMTVPCGKLCCWQHVRDLGTGKHFICSEHWVSQLEAIAVNDPTAKAGGF